MADLGEVQFSDLAGWPDHDHETAFAAFRHSAPYLLQKPPTGREGSAHATDLLEIAKLALSVKGKIERYAARQFFETNFFPMPLTSTGMLTGYFEPEFQARRIPDEKFSYPLHKRPTDLVSVTTDEAIAAGFTPETSFARQTNQGLRFHLSRDEVMSGDLDHQSLELFWLSDPFDVYVIHIQGSARLKLEDGQITRVAFDGKSGHPYRSLGKILIERGVFTPENISMDGLITYLRQQGDAGVGLLAENPSYIFFKEISYDQLREGGAGKEEDREFGPAAAAGVPLVPMRSIAVDRHIHTFGLPFWLDSSLPQEGSGIVPFRQLAFSHDTGSAIKGPARGDLFVGTGSQAGALAGKMQQQTTFTCLMPKKTIKGRS